MPFLLLPERPGVEILPLYRDDREDVRLERWTAGAHLEHHADGGIEILVLEGRSREGNEEFTRQSWLRLPAGSDLRADAGPEGCRVWVKTGHLL
jgi:hypothetical protein